MARKQQQDDERPIQTRLTRLPLPEAVKVSNRLTTVRNSARAADLFGAILKAVEKANARVAREKEEAANGRKRAS